MKQIQYRFFKYLVINLNRAISQFNSINPVHTDLLWVSGILHDILELCPIAFPRMLCNATSNSIMDRLPSDTVTLRNLLIEIHSNLLKQTIPTLHICFLFARPVSAIHLLPIHEVFSADPNIAITNVARLPITSGRRTPPLNAWEELLSTISDISYISHEDYRLEHRLPDLAISSDAFDTIIKPFTQNASQFKTYATRIVNIPYSFFANAELTYDSNFLAFSSAWLDCCISQYYYDIRTVLPFPSNKNSVTTGHPYFDISKSIQLGKTGKSLPEEWIDKIKAYRYTLLWNCEWPDRKFVDILEAVLKEYPDVLMISRPKPTSPKEFITHGSEHDALESKYKNFLIDRHIDYTFSLMAADACISEISTLYLQFIATGKPVAIYNYYTFMDPTLPYWSHANNLKTLSDIFSFIDNLLAQNTVNSLEVSEFDHYYIGDTDGNNSKRIKAATLIKFYAEEKDFIDKYCPHLKQEETL